jgi:hypothetical protein
MLRTQHIRPKLIRLLLGRPNMTPAMTPKLVSLGDDSSDHPGIPLRYPPKGKKGRMNPVRRKDI